MFAFALGVIGLCFIHQLPTGWLVSLVFLTCCWLHYRFPSFISPLILLSCLGFCWAFIFATWQLQWNLPLFLENKNLVAQGVIASIPEQSTFGVKFLFSAKTLYLSNQTYPGSLFLLTWPGSSPPLHIGDKWQLTLRLKRPHGMMDPGAMDYEAYLFAHGIRARGYVRHQGENTLISRGSFWYGFGNLRQSIKEHTTKILASNDMAGFINALTIGIQEGISQQQWQILRATGTNHLMAIAGLHIGFVVGFIFWLTSFLWRRSARLLEWIPAPQLASLSAIVASMIYSGLAGFAIPTQRAVVMTVVFMGARLLRRHLANWQGFATALCVVLILDPLATLSSGFWLSFMAVGLILYGISQRIGSQGLWWKWGRTQSVITIGLLPLTLLIFHQVSGVSLIANAVAIPWVGFLVLPFALVGVLLQFLLPGIGSALILFSAMTLQWLWSFLAWLASFPILQWSFYIVSPWVFVCAYLAVILIVSPSGFPGRRLAILWLLPLVLVRPQTPAIGSVKFTLLDVGQGLSAVIQTAHHALIFDAGAKWPGDLDMGLSVVIPFLAQSGIRQVDTLIISHGDNDHAGGVASILNTIPVQQVLTSVPGRFTHQNALFCMAGQNWQWDGIHFSILYPFKNNLGLDNDSSCVLQVDDGYHRLLLTGDIEKYAEKILIDTYGSALHSDILIAPHHGSKTSSTQPFVEKIHPRYVLFPLGYLNRFHFPHPSVVLRYQEIHSQLLNTAQNGAISFVFDPQHPLNFPVLYRQDFRHYWNT